MVWGTIRWQQWLRVDMLKGGLLGMSRVLNCVKALILVLNGV